MGNAAFGISRLISALEQDGPLIWLELKEQDKNDPIVQGNKLADAVKRALGDPLFGYAMPYAYGIGLLKSHLNLLGPLTFALSNAEYGLDLAAELLTLQRSGNKVILTFDHTPDNFTIENALWLDAKALRLTKAEAVELAAGRVNESIVLELLEASDHALEIFLANLHRQLDLPPPILPHPNGRQLPVEAEIPFDPEAVLRVMCRQEKWLRALEVAIHHLPDKVPEVLEEAGHHYHERGLHQKLYMLLQQLPGTISQDEEVLYWRLTAASRLNLAEELRSEVEAHLRSHEAAELRALYAGVFAEPQTLLTETERAYRAEPTPLTLYQYGRALVSEPEKSLELLHASVKLAERSRRSYAVARNAGTYTSRLIYAGRYRDAAHWGEWALRQFDAAGLGDAQRRLLLLNNLAYARILIGETVGLEADLQATASHLSSVLPSLARLFRSTLADYLLSTGRAAEALGYYQTNLECAPRKLTGKVALEAVQALLTLGEGEAARREASRALALTENEAPLYRDPAVLATGMALANSDPEKAVKHLQAFLNRHAPNTLAHRQAQAALYLAEAHIALGKDKTAKTVLSRASGLNDLSETGFRLLAGSVYSDLRPLLESPQHRLNLRFLEQSEIRLDGSLVSLPLKAQEALLLLALHPEGLMPERLELELYGHGAKRALTNALYKLRKQIPLSAPPYRVAVTYRLDVSEAVQLLEDGRVRAALEHLLSPLLPDSFAPGVERVREDLEALTRKAVLASSDPEALLALAHHLENDLEVWEVAKQALPKGDARTPLVEARVERVLGEWT